ncbi:MAG: DNA repair protein RadC [Alphaproteobacteria bacterium]|nr:DNA repair protein RadC [Alphaproteobacteria bacterium]
MEVNSTSVNHGHRERLREKLLSAGGETLADYELLELLLMTAIPRKDVKPLAKTLIAKFGDIAGVFTASPQELMETEGVKETTAAAIKTVQQCAIRMLKVKASSAPIIDSWEKIIDYCRAAMGNNKEESLRIIFLDSKNRMIADEQQNKGTINHTPLYPREVLKRSLELRAASIILIHNHPSGDVNPSKEDIAMTSQIKQALLAVNIILHDHIIVSQSGYFSFRNSGFIC